MAACLPRSVDLSYWNDLGAYNFAGSATLVQKVDAVFTLSSHSLLVIRITSLNEPVLFNISTPFPVDVLVGDMY